MMRSSFLLAVAVLVVSVFLRWDYLRHAPFNEDEIDGLHVSWEISQGKAFYKDMWDARAPLAFYANALILRFLPADENAIIGVRSCQQIAVALSIILIFLAVRLMTDAGSALMTCALLAACSFFITRTAQARTDVFMFMFFATAFYAFVKFKAANRRAWLAAAGCALALSALCKHVALFPFAATALYLLAEAKLKYRSRRDVFIDWSVLVVSFFAGFLMTMLVIFGSDILLGIKSFFGEPLLLKYSEGLRRQSARIWPELVFNMPFWLAGIVALISCHRRACAAHDKSEKWPLFFIIANAYFSILYVVVRGNVFEQDLILPAFVCALSLGYFHHDIIAWIHAKKGGHIAIGVFYLLLGFFPIIAGRIYSQWDIGESLRWNNKAHEEFFQSCSVNEGEDPGTIKLASLYSGDFGRVNFLPGRSLAQQKRLIAESLESAPADGYVLSEEGMPIFRHMTHNTVRAEQFGNLLHRNLGNHGVSRLSNICRAEPLLCLDGKPEEKLLGILKSHPPSLIILGNELAQVLFTYEPVKTWLSSNYRFFYDKKVIAWMARPVE